jgi:GT2 family glycosyltransferase
MSDRDHTSLRVSVVIPTRNGEQRLPIVLGALARQTVAPHEFEVIVVDDSSTDGTSAVATASGLARVVRGSAPLGAAGATNLGIRSARAPVIALTDDDTVPAPDWIERGLERLSRTPSGYVAGRIDLALDEPPTVAALLDLGRGYLDQQAYAEQGYAATANAWLRADVVERLGGFDERLLGQGHDRDFGERAREAGLEIEYASEVVVQHPARSRMRDLARVAFRLGRGSAELRRHGVGRLRQLRPPHSQPTYFRPWGSIWGLSRIRASGYDPTIAQRVGLWVQQYFCLQLPLIAGSLSGAWRERGLPGPGLLLRRRTPQS